MARARKLTYDERRALRGSLHDAFARAFNLTKRQVAGFDAGTANPTVQTLARIGRPFGFEVGYIRKIRN